MQILINKLKYLHLLWRGYASQKMYLCQHGVTLKCVSPIEIVIIGGAQFKHMLNIGTVPLRPPDYRQHNTLVYILVINK